MFADRASRSEGGGLICVQIGELFQEIALGSFVFLNAASHPGQLAFTDINGVLRLIMLLEKRLFLRFQFCDRRMLVARILLAFFLDLLDPFFDLSDPERDFLLFLLQFLERDNLIAQLGKIGRLRSAFASEIDFTFLEQAFLVTQRHARPLPLNFQGDFAKACADETHAVTLADLVWRPNLKVVARSVRGRIINCDPPSAR